MLTLMNSTYRRNSGYNLAVFIGFAVVLRKYTQPKLWYNVISLGILTRFSQNQAKTWVLVPHVTGIFDFQRWFAHTSDRYRFRLDS